MSADFKKQLYGAFCIMLLVFPLGVFSQSGSLDQDGFVLVEKQDGEDDGIQGVENGDLQGSDLQDVGEYEDSLISARTNNSDSLEEKQPDIIVSVSDLSGKTQEYIGGKVSIVSNTSSQSSGDVVKEQDIPTQNNDYQEPTGSLSLKDQISENNTAQQKTIVEDSQYDTRDSPISAQKKNKEIPTDDSPQDDFLFDLMLPVAGENIQEDAISNDGEVNQEIFSDTIDGDSLESVNNLFPDLEGQQDLSLGDDVEDISEQDDQENLNEDAEGATGDVDDLAYTPLEVIPSSSIIVYSEELLPELSSVESVNVEGGGSAYCSMIARLNLLQFFPRKQQYVGMSDSSVIAQGNAIDLVFDGISSGVLSNIPVSEIVDAMNDSGTKVFDVYMYKDFGVSSPRSSLKISVDDSPEQKEEKISQQQNHLNKYYNQGHRVVVFRGDDGRLYALDPLRGTKSVVPQRFDSYLLHPDNRNWNYYLLNDQIAEYTTTKNEIIQHFSYSSDTQCLLENYTKVPVSDGYVIPSVSVASSFLECIDDTPELGGGFRI